MKKPIAPRLDLFGLGLTYEALQADLAKFFMSWSEEIEAAAPIFDIEGEFLEKIARDLPHHQAFYAQRAMEARACVKWLEIFKSQKEAKYLKNYNSAPRALGAREQAVYLQGEKEIVEINQLIVEAALRQQQFEEVVEAIKQLGWMVGNITKLRVAELRDIIV